MSLSDDVISKSCVYSANVMFQKFHPPTLLLQLTMWPCHLSRLSSEENLATPIASIIDASMNESRFPQHFKIADV